jgi:hypothetical protein
MGGQHSVSTEKSTACVDATLSMGDRQCDVEADVCAFTLDKGSWGGILRRVPADLSQAAA